MLRYFSLFFDAAVIPSMREIVVALDVFQERAVFNVSDAACWSTWIQGVGHFIGSFIELVVIL